MLDLNRRAQAELRCENDLAVVLAATHLFQEPGTLATAGGLARDWFLSTLRNSRAAREPIAPGAAFVMAEINTRRDTRQRPH